MRGDAFESESNKDADQLEFVLSLIRVVVVHSYVIS